MFERAWLPFALVVLAAGSLVLAGWLGWPRTLPEGPSIIVTAAPPPPRSTTTLVLHVTDTGVPVGARVLLSQHGEPLHIGTIDVFGERQGGGACVLGPDVVGSWNGLVLGRGEARVPVGADDCVPSPAIPYGRYDVLAWRGVEYELWRGTVDLRPGRGRVELAIALERAWRPAGALAADLHVHAYASDDSRMPNPQRVIAQVAAGIQVIGLSDHNDNGDLSADIAQLGYDDVVSIASNELSNDYLHAGVYPVAIDPDRVGGGSPTLDDLNRTTLEEFFAIARRLAGTGVVQLNHPRLRSTALFDTTEWDGHAWPPPWPRAFDALEVIAGHTMFTRPGDDRLDQCVRDFFTITDHGFLVAPLGNSDTHDFNWILDGTARNYVLVDDPRVAPFDQAGFVDAIRRRRVVATDGPWLDVEVAAARGGPTVGPGEALHAAGSVWIDVTVETARFAAVEDVRIVIGGDRGPALAEMIDVPAGRRRFRWAGEIALPRRDTWIAVLAEGDDPMPPEVTGSFHPDRMRDVTPFALASPILVDADGDGWWRRGDAAISIDGPALH
jgi:hypothetical protein